jgi:hypothetical protein
MTLEMSFVLSTVERALVQVVPIICNSDQGSHLENYSSHIHSLRRETAIGDLFCTWRSYQARWSSIDGHLVGLGIVKVDGDTIRESIAFSLKLIRSHKANDHSFT